MAVVNQHVDELLKQLKTLVERLQPLRTQAGEFDAELTQAQRDYDRALGELNAEFTRLQGRKLAVKSALVDRPSFKPLPEAQPRPKPPDPMIGKSEPGSLPLPQEDPRATRKRSLCDHLY